MKIRHPEKDSRGGMNRQCSIAREPSFFRSAIGGHADNGR
jgi:hypothetical protein